MGSDRHYPEEAPVHRVTVDGFWIDRTPVTNREFRKFVERDRLRHLRRDHAGRRRTIPASLPHMLKAGSLVFTPPKHPVDLRDWGDWWTLQVRCQLAACPTATQLLISGLDDHPVVHIAYRDAEAYARWAGKDLPTEAEWEFAARGGLDGAEFAWGDEFTPGGRHMANTWQGEFPARKPQRGRLRAHLAGECVPAERLRPPRHDRQRLGVDDGLVFATSTRPTHRKACCIPENPRGGPRGGKLRPLPAGHQNSPQGDQGRLAFVRAKLLPALSPGRAPCRAGRYLHQPSRLSMRHQREESTMSDDHSDQKAERQFERNTARGSSAATCCSAARH